MKFAPTLLAAAAATALIAVPAEAKPKPRWEIGAGAFATYSPDYYGSSEGSFGGFPVIYVSYRGEHFSILSNGLYDVPAADESYFDFGLSLDLTGNVDSDDRLGLEEIDYVFEAGPKLTGAIYADGHTRLEISVAGRAAFDIGDGYIGWVLQPEFHAMTHLSDTTRIGFFVSPKITFDGYNDVFYTVPTGTPGVTAYRADDGYIGTDFGIRLASDISDRFRISGEVRAIYVKGSVIEDSPLVDEEWNFAARIGFTYALWQSEEMTD